MSLEYQFFCPLKHGVHARPATELSRRASAFRSDVRIVNGRTGQSSNAKSLLSLVGADFRHDDPCVLDISGDDQSDALRELRTFIEQEFAGLDIAVEDAVTKAVDHRLPPSLRMCNPTYLRGRPVVSGIVEGAIVHLATHRVNPELIEAAAESVDVEMDRLAAGFTALASELTARKARSVSLEAGAILGAHIAIANDPEFRDQIESSVRDGQSVAAAIQSAKAYYESVLSNAGSRLIEERQLDLRDVCDLLLRSIYGKAAFVSQNGQHLPESAIAIADELTPQQFLELDKSRIRGLVVNKIGMTSHTAVLARAAGVPMICDLQNSSIALTDGQIAVLDGDHAILLVDPTESIQRYYQREQTKRTRLREQQRARAQLQAGTADGETVRVYANAMSPLEVKKAIDAGADGIGLYRTEWMFLDRPAPPTEGEQFETLAEAVRAAQGKPVVIRLLDVGGDKPVPYLNLPVEENPFLGYRGARIYPEIERVVRGQVRAILRASALGPVRMLVPMIATVAEMQWVRLLVADVMKELKQAGVEFDHELEIGAMVETPAAGLMIAQLARVADFFSIGSNDLIQYLQAADRGNERVRGLQTPYHPAVVAFLKNVVDQAAAAERDISICGEIAGQSECLPLLLGVGLRSLSSEPTAVSVVKARVGDCDASDCAAMVQTATTAVDAGSVRTLCAKLQVKPRSRPLIEPDVVLFDSTAGAREEAIKDLVDNLLLQGRIHDPIDVEEAIWTREKQSSTSVGYGIAIPHCRSRQVLANSISFMRLTKPIAWDETSEDAVRFVFLLTIHDSDADQSHMTILSQLARRIMQDEFREGLERCETPTAVVDHIRDHINLNDVETTAGG